jgi:hypothetical protein
MSYEELVSVVKLALVIEKVAVVVNQNLSTKMQIVF